MSRNDERERIAKESAGRVLTALLPDKAEELAGLVSFANASYDYDQISPFAAGSVAAGVLGAYGALLSLLVKERNEEQSKRGVAVDITKASLSLLSFALTRPKDAATPMPWKNLGVAVSYDYYPTSDGKMIYIHPGYKAQHMCPYLGVPNMNGLGDKTSLDNPDELSGFEHRKALISEGIQKHTFDETWDVCNDVSNNGPSLSGCPVLSPEEFLATEQGKALVARGPVTVDVERVETEASSGGGKRAKTISLRPAKSKPLEGVRVLDLTRILAAPCCGKMLAEQGADVLRIGAPDAVDDVGSFQVDTAIGKRYAQLDLREASARAQLDQLLTETDVLVEHFPGTVFADKYGYTKEKLQALHPTLVHVSVNCYGHSGPWKDKRGWEWVAQACSGLGVAHSQAATPPSDKGGRLPMLATDYVTGYLAAAGTAAALYKRMHQPGYYEVRTSLCQAALEILKPPLQPRTDIPSMGFYDHSRVWSQKWFDEEPFAKFGISRDLLVEDFVEAESQSYGKVLHLPPMVNVMGFEGGFAHPPEARGTSEPKFLSLNGKAPISSSSAAIAKKAAEDGRLPAAC